MAQYSITVGELENFNYKFNLYDYPIFSENYRETLNKKILQHFHFREIGFETADRFNYKLGVRMNEIMPYYNKLYETELIDFDPLITEYYEKTNNTILNSNNYKKYIIDEVIDKVNNFSGNEHQNNSYINGVKETNDKNILQDVISTENENNNNNTTREYQGSKKNVVGGRDDTIDFYDAPQTQLLGDYLTTKTVNKYEDVETTESFNGRKDVDTTNIDKNINKIDNNKTKEDYEKVIDENKTENNIKTNINETKDNIKNKGENIEDSNKNESENVLTFLSGRQNISPSDLIEKYRSILLNIDMMIISNLENLFMGIY